MPEIAKAEGSCSTSAQPTHWYMNLSLPANETVEMEMSVLEVLVLCFCSTAQFSQGACLRSGVLNCGMEELKCSFLYE